MWIWIKEHLYLARIQTWQIIGHLSETESEQLSLQKWLLQAEIERLKVIQTSVKEEFCCSWQITEDGKGSYVGPFHRSEGGNLI